MFLDKLSKFFRKNDGKEKLKTEYASPRNEYYGNVAERYGTVQMILLVVLTVFVLVALLINSEWISYENFYFFFSDFGDYLTSADRDIENVIYDSGDIADFAVYGGKLALAGDYGMKLYTPSGRLAAEDTDPVANPVIETSERYMIVYASGGDEYRVYNLFTQVYSDKTGYPIYGASAADNGSFALITGDGEHISCVRIFNRRFDEIQTVGRASYVVDVSLSPSGDRAAILSYTQSEGKLRTLVYLTSVGKDKPYAEHSFEGSEPLACSVTEKGYVTALMNDRAVTFTPSGEICEEYVYPEGYGISCADAGRYGLALTLHGRDRYIVASFDRKGKMVYNESVSQGAYDIAVFDKYVFLDGAYDVKRIDTSSGKTESISKDIENPAEMVIRNADEVLLCMRSRVRYIKF